MRLRPSLAALAAGVSVAACGAHAHSPSTHTPTTSSPAVRAVTATGTVAGDGPAVTTTTSRPPEVPRTKRHTHHAAVPAVAQGAHIETNLTIRAGGDISPPLVSVPSGVGVRMRVSNEAGAPDTVALSVPSHPGIRVASGATAVLQTGGLRDGAYRILVNGTARGRLVVGAQGGP